MFKKDIQEVRSLIRADAKEIASLSRLCNKLRGVADTSILEFEIEALKRDKEALEERLKELKEARDE